MHSNLLLTHSLRTCAWGESITRVLAAALTAVEPGAAVRRFLKREGDTLWVGEHNYDLSHYERVMVLAVGKAAVPMAEAAAGVLGERLSTAQVVTKSASSFSLQTPRGHPAFSVMAAGHPIPNDQSVLAGQRAAELLQGAGERDLVLLLLSGGGSALLTRPVAGVTLADLQALTRALLASGASINEINTLRKHLDSVKGGGLARMAYPATLAALVLSDVVGNPLDVIASGPAVADTTTFGDAWAVLERYTLADSAPAAIVAHLQRGLAGEFADTPKPGDAVLAGVAHVLVGSNTLAAVAAMQAARAEGFTPLLLTTFLQGEAREAGRMLAAVAREISASSNPLPRPACIIAGGETTVTLRGNGRGGRNQELALAAVNDLAGLENSVLVALATDGDDGPTDAAGAVVTGATLARAGEHGLDPLASLARNDAYPFFDTLGDLLKPGPSGTNVNDLAFVFVR